MSNATDELLKTHLVIEKVLEGFDPKNERFLEITQTLRRTLTAHTWLQDQLFMPALRGQPLIKESFLNEIFQEHRDLDVLLKTLLGTSHDQREEREAIALQIRTVIGAHFQKEATALYPLAGKSISPEKLMSVGDEMAHHATELREVAGIAPSAKNV